MPASERHGPATRAPGCADVLALTRRTAHHHQASPAIDAERRQRLERPAKEQDAASGGPAGAGPCAAAGAAVDAATSQPSASDPERAAVEPAVEWRSVTASAAWSHDPSSGGRPPLGGAHGAPTLRGIMAAVRPGPGHGRARLPLHRGPAWRVPPGPAAPPPRSRALLVGALLVAVVVVVASSVDSTPLGSVRGHRPASSRRAAITDRGRADPRAVRHRVRDRRGDLLRRRGPDHLDRHPLPAQARRRHAAAADARQRHRRGRVDRRARP